MLKKMLAPAVFAVFACSCTETCKRESKTMEDVFSEVKKDTAKLRQFFIDMPLGGDIHHHASGSPEAEDFLSYAMADSLWIDTDSTSASAYQLYSAIDEKKPASAEEVNSFLANEPSQRQTIINYWSDLGCTAYGEDCHDWFFGTFPKFNLAFLGHQSQCLSELCKEASELNILYLETMISVPNVQAQVQQNINLAFDKADTADMQSTMEQWYAVMQENGLSDYAKQNADSLDAMYRRTEKHGLLLRFQTYASRMTASLPDVFSQLALGFETQKYTPNLVGINLVAPEDNKYALQYFEEHMAMFSFFKQKYPNAHIALHAGELTHGHGTDSSDLNHHILQSLIVGQANRIGHGVDLFTEDTTAILSFMRKHNCAIEINLESNEAILQTAPENHPFKTYMDHGVPVCLATDDEGILRTDLVNQYMVAVNKYYPEMTYQQIKTISKNAINYSFMSSELKNTVLKEIDSRFQSFETSLLRPQQTAGI